MKGFYSPEQQGTWIGPDTTYDEQRKCRMQDAIDDYLQDSTVDARRTYEEMLSCIDDVIEYHKCNYEKAKQLRELMLETDLLIPSDLTDEWESYLACVVNP